MNLPELGVVVKAVDQGSLEALTDWIAKCNESSRTSVPEKIDDLLRRQDREPDDSSDAKFQDGSLQEWAAFRLVSAAVGPVNVTDVRNAAMTNSFIIAFGVDMSEEAQKVSSVLSSHFHRPARGVSHSRVKHLVTSIAARK